jgi:hypothetical protein
MQPKLDAMSGFHIHSFGIVAEDKNGDDDYIKAFPAETLPLAKGGRLADIKFDYNVSGTDHKGVAVNSNVKGVAYVVAQYVAIGDGNRQTAPNVYESETVLLWRYANDDKFYWTDLMREPTLRRLEHIVYAISNLKEKGQKFDNDSSHWFMFSSREQKIQLHSSKNRDEPVGFDVTFDLAKGTITIEDTNQNSFVWDGVNGDLSITMNRDINLYAKRDVNITADNNINLHAKVDIVNQADNNINSTATNALTEQAKTIAMNADQTLNGQAGTNLTMAAGAVGSLQGGGGANIAVDVNADITGAEVNLG